MYDNIVYQDKTLKAWAAVLHNQYSMGELYRMMREGVSFMDIAR